GRPGRRVRDHRPHGRPGGGRDRPRRGLGGLAGRRLPGWSGRVHGPGSARLRARHGGRHGPAGRPDLPERELPAANHVIVSHLAIVAGLGYGDSGKGTVVDWLCSPLGSRPVQTVVRFNGGAQAAHNVLTRDGRHHAFAQFGAGTFTPRVRTHLSRFVLLDPLALAAEAAHLAIVGVPDALDRLTVDRDALLTTPYHPAANRARELARGNHRHGSCGMGIGETASYALAHPADAPRAGDCTSPPALARKLATLRDRLTEDIGPLGGPPAADVCDAYRAFADR